MAVVQDAFDDLTLREALKAFRDREDLSEKTDKARPEARLHMDRHDTAHVVLGLNTSLRQEALVDLWTIFGTDARWQDMTAYLRLAEEMEIIRQIGWVGMTVSTLRAVWDMPGVVYHTRHQKRKWPWRDYHELLDEPIAALRLSYGIQRLL